MAKYLKINPPKRGSKITVAKNGQLQVPDDPVIPFVQGDGISAEVWRASERVFEAAVEHCYGNAKRLEWMEVHAGERGNEIYGTGNWLPEDTIRAIQEYKVCVKGPLSTPVGQPKSLDTNLREKLELFARVQPIRYLEGLPSPAERSKGLSMTIFREHTEELHSEIEWKKGSPEAKQLINFINNDLNKRSAERAIRPDSSIGIKPISATATKRVMRLAIEYAIKHRKKSVTFVHKGDVMRLTEGFFRDWGYELAKKEFGDYIVTERPFEGDRNGDLPKGKVLVRDRLADTMMEDMLTRPFDYDVVVATNLNGDYLSSLALTLVGDARMSPTGYIGAKAALFQSTLAMPLNGDAESDVCPGSVLLAGVMLFEHLGWKDAAELVASALGRTIADGTVTRDLARKMPGAKILTTSQFCDRLIDNFEEVRNARVREAMERTAIRA
ncbi:MAG: NADP-dependent isocitrate dehydrogenase [Deltaproteobacteria bacterium]|nr:NADP-dependent isocitrate dehydrogenase [Deltaproteobacteria bacterium]